MSLLLNRRFAQEFVQNHGWRVQKVHFRLTSLFCTAHHLLRIALRLQRWRWFSPVGSPKRGNGGPFCIPDPLNSDFDNSTGLKGVCLKARPSPFAHNPNLKTKLSLCCPFAVKRKRWPHPFLCVFYSLWPYKNSIQRRIWIVEGLNFWIWMTWNSVFRATEKYGKKLKLNCPFLSIFSRPGNLRLLYWHIMAQRNLKLPTVLFNVRAFPFPSFLAHFHLRRIEEGNQPITWCDTFVHNEICFCFCFVFLSNFISGPFLGLVTCYERKFKHWVVGWRG